MTWIGWTLTSATALIVIAAVAAHTWLVAITVEGHSMEPALHDGDRVLVLRRGIRRVRRGDIVVFECPQYDRWTQPPPQRHRFDGREWYVKRAAAMPGDPVPEPVSHIVTEAVVPADRLVVLGDGGSSADSRKWGYVPAERLLGVVVGRIVADRLNFRHR